MTVFIKLSCTLVTIELIFSDNDSDYDTVDVEDEMPPERFE